MNIYLVIIVWTRGSSAMLFWLFAFHSHISETRRTIPFIRHPNGWWSRCAHLDRDAGSPLRVREETLKLFRDWYLKKGKSEILPALKLKALDYIEVLGSTLLKIENRQSVLVSLKLRLDDASNCQRWIQHVGSWQSRLHKQYTSKIFIQTAKFSAYETNIFEDSARAIGRLVLSNNKHNGKR